VEIRLPTKEEERKHEELHVADKEVKGSWGQCKEADDGKKKIWILDSVDFYPSILIAMTRCILIKVVVF
jgi:hypothetical protein